MIPRVSPTVPTAEAVSYRQTDSGNPSARLIVMPPAKNSETYITAIVAAFLIALPSSRLPKASVCSLRRKVEDTLIIYTANVVVCIPPAGDPGELPMNIRNIITAFDGPVMADKSAVLKPAVRVVTD